MIRPITYQGVGNFDPNLYALEVASRFIDQQAAHGYYKGYGAELAATVSGNNIAIDTGAFVICGRMNVVTIAETLAVTITSGHVGYIIAHVETYHPADPKNCTFIVRTAPTYAEIPLTQNNIYVDETNTVNKIFELPIYKFSISGGGIAGLTRLIKPVEDYAIVKAIADSAQTAATSAINTANSANATANAANTTSQAANKTADEANGVSQTANLTANGAKIIAENSAALVENLSTQIGEKQGTTVTLNNTPLARFESSGLVTENDVIILDGGVA